MRKIGIEEIFYVNKHVVVPTHEDLVNARLAGDAARKTLFYVG